MELYYLTFENFERYRLRVKGEHRRKCCDTAFKLLTTPESINAMIQCIELGLTPLNGVARMLEENVPCNEAYIRQIIGREIEYILEPFGYKVDPERKHQRDRLRNVSKATIFKTGSKYIKVTNKPLLSLNIQIVKRYGDGKKA